MPRRAPGLGTHGACAVGDPLPNIHPAACPGTRDRLQARRMLPAFADSRARRPAFREGDRKTTA